MLQKIRELEMLDQSFRQKNREQAEGGEKKWHQNRWELMASSKKTK